MPPSEKPIAHVPSDEADLPVAPAHKPMGEVVGDVPRRRLAEVPPEECRSRMYCGPHRSKPRRLVAVLTKQGRLLTSNEDVDWVSPPYDSVLAPCDRCTLPGGERYLSVEKLRQALGHRDRDVRFDEVLAD